ncbi:MAG: hypothetical protein ACKVQK_21350 [Burkholderiales bacterium]
MKSGLLYLIGSCILCMSMLAFGQVRPIPDDVQRGWLRHIQGNVISIDEKAIQLAPGGNIRNEQNLIIVPASLPGAGALAEYQLDPSGQVSRAWLLTPQEAARSRPRR